ncbi:hypothetical protein F5Y16DRAFT_400344 [Xylariaceae sp. FL0255]|nr:hypothetical protein F5Y16DRAFT_400344 [Xylariaceae sp. FL0255]
MDARYNTNGSGPWPMIKITLQCISILLSIALIGLSAILATGSPRTCILAFVVPPSGLSIISGFVELIVMVMRGRHRGLGLGGHVALHLLLWLGFTVAVGLTALTIKSAVEYNRSYSSYYGTETSFFSAAYMTKLNTAIALSAVLDLTHFVLFVRLCVEVATRNEAESVEHVAIASQASLYDTTTTQFVYPAVHTPQKQVSPQYYPQYQDPYQVPYQVPYQGSYQVYSPRQAPRQAYMAGAEQGLTNGVYAQTSQIPAQVSTHVHEETATRTPPVQEMPVSPVSPGGWKTGHNDNELTSGQNPFQNNAGHVYTYSGYNQGYNSYHQ